MEPARDALRPLREADWPQVDALTALCYAPIQAAYVGMVGAALDEAVRGGEPWDARKARQNRELARAAGGEVWVLDDGAVFGFICLRAHPERGYGSIHNNGVHPDRTGQGWGRLMVGAALERFRALGLRHAYVDTGLDPAHDAARRVYEACGFDRRVPVVEMWQTL